MLGAFAHRAADAQQVEMQMHNSSCWERTNALDAE
jgi:hypothetical protein